MTIPLNRLPMPMPRPQQASSANPFAMGGGQSRGPMGRLDGFLRNNSDALLMAGLGMMAGGTGREQAMLGMQGFAQGRQSARDRQRQNQTVEFLRTVNPEIAAAVEAGALSPGDAYKMHVSTVRTPQDGPSYSKTPIFGTDAEGNRVLGTIGDDGSFRQIDTGGFSVEEPYEKLDVGTHFELRDRRTGALLSRIPKENYQEGFDSSRGAAEGKAMGEEAAVLRDMQGNMPGLERTMDELRTLSETATFTLGGQARDFAVRQMGGTTEGALARTQYEAIVNNQILPLLRQTFGAQFTVEEGRQLRATLGDPNKSPSEKQAVLEAFIAQKRRDIEAQRVRAGEASPQAVTPRQQGQQGGAADLDALIDMYAD